MSTITSRKVVGILMLTALALQRSLGGDSGSGASSDSTTITSSTTVTLVGDPSAGKPSKDAKTDKNAPKLYWLTQHIDAVTDTGVTGFRTGTKVTWMSTGKDGKLKVKSDDNIVFEVTKDQVTDDPDQAEAIARQQADQEAAQAAALAQQQQAAALAAALQPTPVIVLPAVAQAPSSNTGSLAGTSLDKGAYDDVTSPKPKPTPRPANVNVRR